jgi:hypothetical protein
MIIDIINVLIIPFACFLVAIISVVLTVGLMVVLKFLIWVAEILDI